MCQGVCYSIGGTHPSYAREKTSFIKGGGGGGRGCYINQINQCMLRLTWHLFDHAWPDKGRLRDVI